MEDPSKANGLALKVVVLKVRLSLASGTSALPLGIWSCSRNRCKIQARDLAARDKGGTSDPVRLQLFP